MTDFKHVEEQIEELRDYKCISLQCCNKQNAAADTMQALLDENGMLKDKSAANADHAKLANENRTYAASALKKANARNKLLEDVAKAAVPFSHDDLCEYLGGNADGEDSIVFQRNFAYLRIRDFRRTRAALAKLQEQDND